MLVHVQDVLREAAVRVAVGAVQDEPQQVEAGQQRGGQVDVLRGGPPQVVPAPATAAAQTSAHIKVQFPLKFDTSSVEGHK